MVAKTPQSKEKERRMASAINPNRVRETLKKVDQCLSRLEELHFTLVVGKKVTVRCKQESLRSKNAAVRRSPTGKFPEKSPGDWHGTSLQTMLLAETMVEIQKASGFAKEAVAAAATKPRTNRKSSASTDPKTPVTNRSRNRPLHSGETTELQEIQKASSLARKPRTNRKPSASNDPKTPVTIRSRNKPMHSGETTELRAKRTREKRRVLQKRRTESGSPATPRARSRIIFRIVSPSVRRDHHHSRQQPPIRRDHHNSRPVIAANRVSPKNRPWAKKAVLFPNPIFVSSASNHQQTFWKTRSPMISRRRPII